MTADAKPPMNEFDPLTYGPAFKRLLADLGIDVEVLPRQRDLQILAAKAFAAGVEAGYGSGRNDGFADGYEDGYSAGLKEAR